MEKKAINFSFNKFITQFRRAHKDSLDPNMLWRAVLWAGLIGVGIVAIFGYITYDWALSVEAPGQASRTNRDGFSLAALEEVIALYHQKEVNFAALLRTPPSAPDYRRSKGIVATSSPDLQIDESTDIVAQPMRTQ